MTFPFVQAYHDAGRRAGPVRGFTIHMAEGGGTVGYLAKRNPNGVSVHYVIERSGRTVQMLLESHMHTSIRIRNADGTSAIRQGDDADGFYGRTAARAVLGDWYDVRSTLGPNHATIAVELEGFAAEGPNPDQEAALVRLTNDIRSRFPMIGLLGHRDHNVKACPGRRIPWAELGGHGPALPDTTTEEDMALAFKIIESQPGTGTVTVAHDNVSAVVFKDGTLYGLAKGTTKRSYAKVELVPPYRGIDEPLYLIGEDGAGLFASNVTFVPDPSVAAQRERDRVAHLANVEKVYAS